MRDVSNNFKNYVTKLENNDKIVWLITLSHQGVVNSMLCSHHVEINSLGRLFVPTSMTIRAPAANLLKSNTSGRLKLENVSRNLIEWIRVECTSRPQISLELILLSTPDVIEYGPIELNIGKTNLDSKNITLPLEMQDLFKKPFQSINFDPSRAPGIFV